MYIVFRLSRSFRTQNISVANSFATFAPCILVFAGPSDITYLNYWVITCYPSLVTSYRQRNCLFSHIRIFPDFNAMLVTFCIGTIHPSSLGMIDSNLGWLGKWQNLSWIYSAELLGHFESSPPRTEYFTETYRYCSRHKIQALDNFTLQAPEFESSFVLPRVDTGGQTKPNPHSLFNIDMWGGGCHATLFPRGWIILIFQGTNQQ